MLEERNLVEESQDNPGDEEGSDQGESWDRNAKEQLFGKTESGDQEVKDPDGQSEDGELPVERVQKHPIVADLRSKTDRQGNVIKSLNTRLTQVQEALKLFRKSQTDAIIGQMGDTPEARALLERVTNLDDREADLILRESVTLPILQQQTVSAIMKDYGLPEEFRDELMQTSNAAEAELFGQRLQRVLAKMPKDSTTKPGGGKGTTLGKGQQRQPALGHVPDKALGSVSPQSFEQAENDYIAGKISLHAYEAAAKKAGVSLQ